MQLLVGLGGLGIEIAKDLALAGIKYVPISSLLEAKRTGVSLLLLLPASGKSHALNETQTKTEIQTRATKKTS
jgi:hypothetical protein